MRLVGAVVLDAARMPGAVRTPGGDVSTTVRVRMRTVAHLLWRVATAALRRLPTMVAMVRTRPALAVGRAGGPGAAPGPHRVTRGRAARRLRRPAVGATTLSAPTAAPLSHRLALPADPTAPRLARALLRTAAHDWNLDDDVHQDAAMVVTELVANVVDHAHTPSTLTLGLDERGLCVAVRDGRSDPLLRPRPVDPAAPRGRGLQMIAALATSWGVTTHLDGKTVWAVLPRG